MTIEDMKGIGPKGIKMLGQLGIHTMEDFITYYPFRYEEIKKDNLDISKDGEKITIDGIIETIPNVFHFHKKMDKMTFKLNAQNRLLQVTIFNRGYLKRYLEIGKTVTVIGKYEQLKNRITASELRLGGIAKDSYEPVYHTTYGITSRQMSHYISLALKEPFQVADWIPSNYQQKYQFMSKTKCIHILHNPENLEELNQALNRMKYEELFLFMLKMNYLKNNKGNQIGLNRDVLYSLVEQFITGLPFELTVDQKKSIEEIYHDLMCPRRMNRLLQGDVGSGKTVVAMVAMYINYLSGYQSALMAPTEILATQHYQNALRLFANTEVHIGLLTGKLKVREKKEIYQKLQTGELDIVIGTHALFTEAVRYQNLGLVITDEQHRFGVSQRSSLKNKGITPDILYMSATPIPRTYALTLYGDMDISSIKTVPKGRKEILTSVRKNSEIRTVLESMFQELKKGHQVYVIAPLIEESEKSDFENVYELEEKMKKAFGKFYQIGVLHGKMKAVEKQEVMDAFSNNTIQILISTTVVEVGVDVPNATMMVIFDSYRFGLSALHQLRGRVGRNSLQSYCILMSDRETERLKVLEKTNDGFKISEEDFLLRGSGDVFGLKQSGDMVFQLADLKKDFEILLKAKLDSEEFLENYEEVNEEEKGLMTYIQRSMDLD